eukprot:CAMPEP_0177754712 /NCGR_PEP_ID=MMETSP0491_2-20121128/2157_1 /TAXON_ID=63592 /ORGANISM="Tetraselmis chuii, Strain PLY429" /LENGTH=859 /DNA_ID=CAMNT_0019270117 /DNA_START=493 /DNA_END=3072 /DNA_ORIENTATION=-
MSSARAGKSSKMREATELLPSSSPPKQVPLPMDENLPEPCALCPVVQSISPSQGPVAGLVTVTISGQQLGSHRTLRAVTVGSVPCISFESIDPSHLTCQIPPGTGANLPVMVTVDTREGQHRGASLSLEARWSYLPPKVRSVSPNHAPRTGGSTITITGEGFGRSESYPIATIGGIPCQSTKWISDATVKCVVPSGAGVKLAVHVTVCGCGDASRSPQSSINAGAPDVAFSYDEDVMKSSGRSIIHGMDLHPNRANPVITNLKQLGTQYEIKFTNPVTGRPIHYGVPPELAAVLPKADLSKRYDSCAVVGPAGNLAGSGFGDQIDSTSAVFRINNAPTHRFQNDVGSKTTFQVINQFWTEMLMNSGEGPQDAKWWYEEATLVLWSHYSQESYVLLRQLFPVSGVVFMSRNLVSIGASISDRMRSRIQETMSASFGGVTEPSSTFYAALMAIQLCNEVRLYGVDTRSGKFHYYDDADQGDEERIHEGLEYLMYLVMQANGYISSIHDATGIASGGVKGEGAGAAVAPALECTVRPCILNCNGRGSSVNGTCHCEPIYAGSDCSISLMAAAAEELLEGLDINYKAGPVQMCKAAVNGTVIDLPEGITRGKLKEGDVYQVDRALYHALPDDDLNERFASCAVIGNSGMLMNDELGREIDAHDMVYRFNQAPTKGYELHVGARTTHESLNGFWTKAVLDERRGFRWNWRSRDTALVLFEMFEPAAFGWKTKTQIIEKDHWWRQSYVRLRKMYPDRKIISLNPHFVSWSYLQYRELRRRMQRKKLGRYPGEKPMSGIYAFLFLLQVCDELDMYGFQPWREDARDQARYHYFDNAEPRPGSHSFDLARYLYQLIALKYDHVRIVD